VIVPAGSYIITKTIEIKFSNIVLRGAGVRPGGLGWAGLGCLPARLRLPVRCAGTASQPAASLSPSLLFNLAEPWPCMPLPVALPAEREDNVVLSKRAAEGVRSKRHLGLWRRFPHVSTWLGSLPPRQPCMPGMFAGSKLRRTSSACPGSPSKRPPSALLCSAALMGSTPAATRRITCGPKSRQMLAGATDA
jgi:hypothetical protein